MELAQDKIRHDILAGVIAPGAKVRIEELRNSYGIGASPLACASGRAVSKARDRSLA